MIASLHLLAAAAALAAAIGVLLAGATRLALAPALACLAAALWAGAVAFAPADPLGGLPGLLEVSRNLVWGVVLLLLHRRLGGGRVLWGFAAVLAVVGAASVLACLSSSDVLDMLDLPTRLGLALVVVMLAENLARNSGEASGWHLWPPAIALGGLGAFDVLLYSTIVLADAVDGRLIAARALLTALALPLLVLAARRDRRWRQAALSHQVVFHGATLLVAGAFLLGAGLVGSVLRGLDAEWGGAAQIALLAGALLAVVVLLSSRSARSRIQRWLGRHVLAARYDYRREWLRAVATLSDPLSAAAPHARAIRAIADPADSPAGTLLLAEEGAAGLRRGACWNQGEGPERLGPDHPAWDRLRAGEVVPGDGEAWLAVPLLHHSGTLLGAVTLDRPRAPQPVDEELLELLGTLGREVAMFLAERRAAEKLVEGKRVADYARRFAFVAHDVKTVSSQLSLVLRNAEAHMEDPEFQRDMLLTVRGATSRINALIARLRRDEAADAAAGTADPLALVECLARELPHPVEIEAPAPVPPVAMAEEALGAAMTHLLRNAMEASSGETPVRIRLGRKGDMLEIEIADRGHGMSDAFLREELFRPLATTKPGGTGIGAWQSRELVREAGGELTVDSREGEGTRVRLRLPLAGREAVSA